MAEVAFQLSLISLFHSKAALKDILDEKSDLSPGLRDLFEIVTHLQDDFSGFSRSYNFGVLKERIEKNLRRFRASSTAPDDAYSEIRRTIEILLSQFLSIPCILRSESSQGYVHTVSCVFHPQIESINLERLIVHKLGGQKLEALPTPAFIVYLKREIDSNELVLPPIFLNMKNIVTGEQGNVLFVLSSLVSYGTSKKKWYVHIRKSAKPPGSASIWTKISIVKSVVRHKADETLENQLGFWNNMQSYEAIQTLQQSNSAPTNTEGHLAVTTAVPVNNSIPPIDFDGVNYQEKIWNPVPKYSPHCQETEDLVVKSNAKDETTNSSAIGLLVAVVALKSKHNALRSLSSLALGNKNITNKFEVDLLQTMANLKDTDLKPDILKLSLKLKFQSSDPMLMFEELLSHTLQLQGNFKTSANSKHCFVTQGRLKNHAPLTTLDLLLSLELYAYKTKVRIYPNSVLVLGINRNDSNQGVIPNLKLNLAKRFTVTENEECKEHASLSSVICKQSDSYCVYKREKGNRLSCSRIATDGSQLEIIPVLCKKDGCVLDSLLRNLESNPRMHVDSSNESANVHLTTLLSYSIAFLYCNKPLKSSGGIYPDLDAIINPTTMVENRELLQSTGFKETLALPTTTEYSCLAGLLFSMFYFPSSLNGILHDVSKQCTMESLRADVIIPLQRGDSGSLSKITTIQHAKPTFRETLTYFASSYLEISGFISEDSSHASSYYVDLYVLSRDTFSPNFITVGKYCTRKHICLNATLQRGLIFNIVHVAYESRKSLIPDLKISLPVKRASQQQQLILSAVMCKTGSHEFISYARDSSQPVHPFNRWIKRLPEGKIESVSDVELSLETSIDQFDEELSENMRIILNQSVALFYVLPAETLL